jgi:hypothetical protein
MAMPIVDFLLLALAQGSAPPQAPPAPPPLPWHAVGTESEWTLTIADGRIHFAAAGQPPVSVAAVTPKLGESGWTWAAHGLRIDTLPMGCEAKNEDRYRDFVSVTVGRREYLGCGGAKLAPDDLFGTGWEIVEIAGGRVGGANYGIDFADGRFLAYDGCHRVDGTYRQEDGKLSLKIGGGTVGGCGPITRACAARFWQILSEPVDMAFTDRTHLVLTGRTGIVRLQTPDKEHLFDRREPRPCGAAGK